jgi:hypothetical protein
LWFATGRQYGNCNVTLRPCRKDCGDVPFGLRWFDELWYGASGEWPYPALIDGAWVNLACGVCSHSCGCSETSEVVLPELAAEIIEVQVDGEVLPFGTGWVIYDSMTLVRADGGRWPMCQDWTITGGPGAWSITARFGEAVPKMGQLAVGELACELLKACLGQDCALPGNVVSIDKQGVGYQFADPVEMFKEGLIGLPLCDRFINAVNPAHVQDRARAFSPDVFKGRVQ